jgi:hypothetical protein
MAKNTVRKRVEVNDIRDPYYCVWLQEMAEKGFLYKHRDLFTCVFEKALPQIKQGLMNNSCTVIPYEMDYKKCLLMRDLM